MASCMPMNAMGTGPSPTPAHVPQRPGGERRAGVVAHRGGPPLRVDLGSDGLPDGELPAEPAAEHVEAGNGLLAVLDLEDGGAVGGPEHAPIADLAAALGIERRPVEDDLGPGGGLGSELLFI